MSIATTAQYTRSAPAIMQSRHFDGITVTSSIYVRSIGAQARTATRSTPCSQDETCTPFHTTILFVCPRMSDRVRNTTTWVYDANGPRLIRGNAPSEPSSMAPQPQLRADATETKSLCDCCAAARVVRELSQKMAEDNAVIPPVDDNVDHYFPELNGGMPYQQRILSA